MTEGPDAPVIVSDQSPLEHAVIKIHTHPHANKKTEEYVRQDRALYNGFKLMIPVHLHPKGLRTLIKSFRPPNNRLSHPEDACITLLSIMAKVS